MILKNCRLVPELCEGFREECADIRIENGTIAEILPAGGAYTGEEVIDCTGKTVLPGLFNLHVHLPLMMGPLPESDHLLYGLRYAQTLLAYGYTSLRDVGSAHNAVIEIRNRINAGLVVGPDIRTSGHILTPNGNQTSLPMLDMYTHRAGRPINSAADAHREGLKELELGADFLKILATGANQFGPRGDGLLFYNGEVEELVNVANHEGTYLAVHTISEESAMQALDAGVYTIEHGLHMTQANIDAFVKYGFRTQLVATAAVVADVGNMFGDPTYLPDQCCGWMPAHEAGVLIGWGTDSSEESFLANPALEFTAREQLGFKKIDILKQATVNSAKINKVDALRGTIAVGKKADLAIFEGKPDEDFTIFNKPCDYVLQDGVVVASRGFVKGGAGPHSQAAGFGGVK